jgi:O-antigen ligase
MFFIFFIIISYPLLSERFHRIFYQFDRFSTNIRIELFKASIESFKQFPILGTGPGSIVDYVSKNPAVTEFLFVVKGTNDLVAMHNNYLLILVESGGLGLTFFLIFLLKYWKYIQNIKQKLSKNDRVLQLTLDSVNIAFVTFLISGISTVNFGMNIIWFILSYPFIIHRIAKFQSKISESQN